MMSSAEADLVHQDVVGALGDGGLALDRVGLALLVERHDHHRSAVAAHDPGWRRNSASPSLSEIEFTTDLPAGI